MIAVTGAAMVLSRLPGLSAGPELLLALLGAHEDDRAGCEFCEVGPHFMMSWICRSWSSLTGLSWKTLWVRRGAQEGVEGFGVDHGRDPSAGRRARSSYGRETSRFRPSSASRTEANTESQSPALGWRNRRAEGYQGARVPPSCQRQSAADGSSTQVRMPIAAAEMGDRRVDRDQEIELRQRGRRLGEIEDAAADIVHQAAGAELLDVLLVHAALQAEHQQLGIAGQRQELARTAPSAGGPAAGRASPPSRCRCAAWPSRDGRA